jgi:response regulator NasT
MELAITRFNESLKLIQENADLRDTLEARKVIEKAKGLIMDKEKLTEGEAFSRMRKLSMDTRVPLKEVARGLITALEAKKCFS